VRALFDADSPVIAIHCFDREPGAIIGTQMKRTPSCRRTTAS